MLNFQHNFLTFVDFHDYGWRSSQCQFSMIFVSLESFRWLLRSVTNLARSRAWACEIWPHEQRLPECFSVSESHFPTKILSRPGKILEIWELHVVAECVFFLKVSNLRINSQRVKKTLCKKVIPREEKKCWISSTISLLSLIFPHIVDVALSVGFQLSSCPWKACDVFLIVSQISREVELGPVRYDPANRGCWCVFPW